MNLEQRVAALEAETQVVRQQAAAAHALASGADREVADYRAEMRGHTRMLNALRETQVEQGEMIATLNGRVATLNGRVATLDGRVATVEGKIDQLTGTVNHIRDQHGARLADIAGLLEELIDRDGAPE